MARPVLVLTNLGAVGIGIGLEENTLLGGI